MSIKNNLIIVTAGAKQHGAQIDLCRMGVLVIVSLR